MSGSCTASFASPQCFSPRNREHMYMHSNNLTMDYITHCLQLGVLVVAAGGFLLSRVSVPSSGQPAGAGFSKLNDAGQVSRSFLCLVTICLIRGRNSHPPTALARTSVASEPPASAPAPQAWRMGVWPHGHKYKRHLGIVSISASVCVLALYRPGYAFAGVTPA